MVKRAIEKHFDKIAKNYDSGKRKYKYYYDSLKKLLKELIPQGKKVFEVGCGTGDLLNHLKPKYGYGQDVSRKMISISSRKYQKSKNLKFSTIWPSGQFDFIFMSDVVEHLEDSAGTFKKISGLMNKKTILVVTMANPIWEPLLMFWEWMGWKMPEGPHNRIRNQELGIILKKAGLKIIKHDYKLLVPIRIPFITNFANRYLEEYLKPIAFVEYFIAVKR